MTKRQDYLATIVAEDQQYGKTTHTAAWNSAIHATETHVRELARAEGQTYTGEAPSVVGGKPGAPGALYTRAWRGDRTGRLIIAAVMLND